MKMQKEKYRERINVLDNIPLVVDDLAGIRVTCNNSCDVLSMMEMLGNLPSSEDEHQYEWLSFEPDSEKRYIEDPKESGYRAYHINLRTLLQTPQGWKVVRGELQVRTLLQDGWGELTHEDTYKPDLKLPDHATNLSRRMADLLATVDDLAQDLRNELDRLAQASIEGAAQGGEEREGAEASAVTMGASAENIKQALVLETRRVINSLTKAATLAEVAQRVQSTFGTKLVPAWAGYGSFIEVVRTAAPGATIIQAPPGLVVPPGVSAPPRAEREGKIDESVPPIVARLGVHDKSLIQGGPDKLKKVMDCVLESLTPAVWGDLGISDRNLGIREINQLSKRGRDDASENGAPVGRQNIDYFLKVLLFSRNLRPGLSRDDVDEIMTKWLLARGSKLALVTDPQKDEQDLRKWFSDAR